MPWRPGPDGEEAEEAPQAAPLAAVRDDLPAQAGWKADHVCPVQAAPGALDQPGEQARRLDSRPPLRPVSGPRGGRRWAGAGEAPTRSSSSPLSGADQATTPWVAIPA